jgi:hypothetical protein
MLVTELDTFVNKFRQLWNAGYNAHLDLDTHAGLAWVGLRVQLGYVPGPLHHQVSSPFSKNWRKAESPSRQRRRARRTAERQRQAAAGKAPMTEAVKDVIDKKSSESIDAIDETVGKENLSMEAFRNKDVVKFNEFIEHETEQVEVSSTENVELQIQADKESFEISNVEHKNALEKSQIFKDKFDNSADTTEETTEINSFCTSTPKSECDRCEECLDNTECVDCYVKHMLRKHESLRKVLF